MKEKRSLIAEGKTKRIWSYEDNPKKIVIENKNSITANDDPTKTKEFEAKARYATNTTCRVFELLKQAGIPVAFEKQLSDTEFLAPRCTMVPLEVIARRYAVGSYLKRFPNMSTNSNDPDRFHSLKIELFLKTTGGELEISGKKVVEGLNPKKGEEDPLIIIDPEGNWKLYHPKTPSWEERAFLNKVIYPVTFFSLIPEVIKNALLVEDSSDYPIKGYCESSIETITELTRRTFLVLESAWAQQNMRLIDFKIEFGFTADGELLVADVIDNDSWRLRTKNWTELSKESFRQGGALSEVEKKYGKVSQMVDNFRLPNQALVIWKGSEKDSSPNINSEELEKIGVNVVEVVLSGHKSPAKALVKLEKILQSYPDGGVIITKVGRSNGLGPILAARTSWPVIACPATIKEYPEDAWSSLRMPSRVPLLTAWPEENAVFAALNILAQKNPAIYSDCQYDIEELDN